jgi:uncharacterized protein (TIGR03437 family)
LGHHTLNVVTTHASPAIASMSFGGRPQGAVGLCQINFIVPGGLPSGTAVPLSPSGCPYAEGDNQ